MASQAGGRGGANQRVTVASCGVRAVPACVRAKCVCEQDKEPEKNKQNKKKRETEEKLKSEASWLLSSCGGDEKVSGVEHEVWTHRNSEVREGGVHKAHKHKPRHVPTWIFQMLHSHCSGFFVLLQTASSSLVVMMAGAAVTPSSVLLFFWWKQTRFFFLFPPFFGGTNRSLGAFVLLPLRWTGWQNTSFRL